MELLVRGSWAGTMDAMAGGGVGKSSAPVFVFYCFRCVFLRERRDGRREHNEWRPCFIPRSFGASAVFIIMALWINGEYP